VTIIILKLAARETQNLGHATRCRKCEKLFSVGYVYFWTSCTCTCRPSGKRLLYPQFPLSTAILL